MDITTLPGLSTLLHAGTTLVTTLTDLLTPVAGTAAAALAVVLLTLAVRLVLVPLAVLQVRAERLEVELIPQPRPERLQRERRVIATAVEAPVHRRLDARAGRAEGRRS